MKGILFILLSAVFVSSVYGSGLGDTVESIKREYGKALYIEETDCFGSPSRAGNISGNAVGLFGAPSGVNPLSSEFFSGIKRLIPADSKLISAHRGTEPWITEIYEFKSDKLKLVPSISSALRYDKKYFKYPVGSYFLIVSYDLSNKNRVAVFHLVLGRAGEVDLSGMKKVSKNPFK